MKQKKILSLDLLLTQHWLTYNSEISPIDWFDIVDLPFSIYHFMPFFRQPLYERKRISFSEKSQKIIIELDFPNFNDLRENFIPLFGETMGRETKHNGFVTYNKNQYETLIKTIAMSIDSSIESRKILMSKEHIRKFGSSSSTTQVNKKNSIKGNILWSDEKEWIWDLSDLIQFNYGKQGLRLQSLKPTKNSHEFFLRDPIPKYTVFDHLAHKFVTTLEGFNKREIHYLKRYFNFNLDKTNLVKEFEYNSLDKGVGEWEHYIFSGLGDNSWSFGDVDFLEKILWYFDFRNEKYTNISNLRISDINYQVGSLYWQFSDQKIIRVNDLSNGEFIPTPAHEDEGSYLHASDIESSQIETLLILGIKPEEIREAVCAYMIDWNIGNDFPDWNEQNVKKDLMNRASEIYKYLNKKTEDNQAKIDKELEPMEELVSACVEFYFKYGESIEAIVARDIEPDTLRIEEIIEWHPKYKIRPFKPIHKENIGWIQANLADFLDPREKTYVWFLFSNIQTKEAFLELLPDVLKTTAAPDGVSIPERRMMIEIPKWDMIALKNKFIERDQHWIQ